jgi:hypothetical protein
MTVDEHAVGTKQQTQQASGLLHVGQAAGLLLFN